MGSTLASMTGFGRASGRGWSWEIRSVNGRGLDVRLKLPAGWDAQEAGFRQAVGAVLKRGSVQGLLAFEREAEPAVTVRTEVLERLMTLAIDLADRIPGALPPRAEALLALPACCGQGRRRRT